MLPSGLDAICICICNQAGFLSKVNMGTDRCLLDGGADPTARTPAAQLGIDPDVAPSLTEAAAAWQVRREAARAVLWDAKMQATQTQSAFGIRTL